MTKVKNSSYDNSKTQIVAKFKNSNCDDSNPQILTKLKTQIMTKLKSNCDKSNTQIVTKLNSNCDKTQKLQLLQNSKTKIVTNQKLKL